MKRIKKTYQKPVIKKLPIDREISLQLMSENTIPSTPPWGENINRNKNPYQTDLT